MTTIGLEFKTKWFYAAQREVEEKMKQYYTDWSCQFQHVRRDRITEFYNVVEANGKQSQCMVSIFKTANKAKYRVMFYRCDFFASIN